MDQKSGARGRKDHTRSSSKNNSDQKSVGEFALHHLFNSFVSKADIKINQCVSGIPESYGKVEDVCGPKVDPEFDSIISALGHIARQKPRHLIDTIMYWRKAKSEEVAAASQQWATVKNANPQGAGQPTLSLDDASGLAVHASYENMVRAERKLSLAIYLICRVITEVYQQSNLESITPTLDDKLEDLIFDQLQRLDPEKVKHSPFQFANWNIYSQLLGVMSTQNFPKVSRRFLKVLSSVQEDSGQRMSTEKESDSRQELMITAMRYLAVETKPEMLWVDSCEFMHNLAKNFSNAHGMSVKHAYCQVLEPLVYSVAAMPGAHFNSPRWKDFVSLMNSRLGQMLVKPRHWVETFPISVLLLCASPAEVFSSQWMGVLSSLQPKLKDRSARGVALQGVCRLVWTYLSRASEPGPTMRKLEDVIRIVLPTGKKANYSTERSVSEPIVELVRIIGYRFPEFCYKAIVFPFISSDLLGSGKEVKVEQLEPDRIVIGIRAFLAILSVAESSQPRRPPYPVFESGGRIPSDTGNNANYLSQFENLDSNAARQQDEKMKRPIDLSRLDDVTRKYFNTFCEILGKITILCDNAFGGQATLDEKFGGQTPKTPMSDGFGFGRRDDQGVDLRQGFYELLHVAVQAIPRCLGSHIPLNSQINLLCTGTAHVQSKIAASSAASLKAIARQGYATQVTSGFARFIFNFDVRYSTMSDEGLLGHSHIENTLTLYLDLLRIWIDEIKQKMKSDEGDGADDSYGGNRGLKLDLTSISAQVDEVESHGIFFLCSQARRVRAFAINVLRVVLEFDAALGRSGPRMIQILEGDVSNVIDAEDESLTVAERSRLQRSKRKGGAANTLVELCSSDVSYDSTLWLKVFPNLIRLSFEQCTVPVTIGRNIVTGRLDQMQPMINSLADGFRLPQSAGSMGSGRFGTPPEIIIEQWKLYLIMACTTLTNTGIQPQIQLTAVQHGRSRSKNQSSGSDKTGSARPLFASIIPLLGSSPSYIRDAIVAGLGSININLYRTLLDSLQYAVTTCNEEAKVRVGGHQRTGSSPRRSRATDRLRTEVTHIYKLTSRFLSDPDVLTDDWIVNNLVKYTDDLRLFLSDADIQSDWEFQTLRRHYCGLLETVYEGILRTSDPLRWISFESRLAAFNLIEDWCGYSPNQAQINAREEGMKRTAIAHSQESGVRDNIGTQIEILKRDLRYAALSAMAALCGGPVNVVDKSRGSSMSFNVPRILSWIDQIFSQETDKMHLVGRRALKSLILHNNNYPRLLEQAMDKCFSAERPKSLESYFDVVSTVLKEAPDYPVPFWRSLVGILYMLGNGKSSVRAQSAQLMRTLEERQGRNSRLQDFDISISDKTTAVYKLAQFEISKRLVRSHSEIAFYVFSQFCQHYRTVRNDNQRNLIAAILPWVQSVELQFDPNGGPTVQTYMLLANLLEITKRSSNVLHNEVQALWQALATGPYPQNVQLILDFVISLCIERREQSLVDYTKQIVVFLSSTPSGHKVVEFLLMQITPKNMVHPEKRPMEIPPDTIGLPYISDLNDIVSSGNKQTGFALGHLALILLVDLMVGPVKLTRDQIPLLLQVCIALWDHYIPLVQEEAREMLVHLIHELVISKTERYPATMPKDDIEEFIEAIRQSKPDVIWSYQESNSKDDEDDSSRVPTSMENVVKNVLATLEITTPNIHELWARTTLSWATSCSVRHIACRSFQIFRCLLSSLDSDMLSDMLARLSNTISDEAPEVQSFAMEIITTLKTIVGALDPTDLLHYPQLFWATSACLNTVNEREYLESLEMLDLLLGKMNLGDPAVIKILNDAKPKKWDKDFEGIMSFVYRGIRSGKSMPKALDVVAKAAALPDTNLIGESGRVLYACLAFLPTFLHSFEPGVEKAGTLQNADILSTMAENDDQADVSLVLDKLAKSQYKTAEEFLTQMIAVIKGSFFPDWEFQTLVFLIGLLSNDTSWVKTKTMNVLCMVMPIVDMRHSKITTHGSDLISPLLRLLQTEHCQQALKVMDCIMTTNAHPMERSHLRMSIVGSGATRNIRKEYDRTQSLYGIPEDTGWSIPAPAIESNTTRCNVHAVFLSCAPKDNANEVARTPDIEFDREEFQQNSYFSLDRMDTMPPEDSRMDGPIEHSLYENPSTDLGSNLDALDDFFDDNGGDVASYEEQFPGGQIAIYSPDPDRGASIYDEQTAPILNKSLARTASITSLSNSYADARTATNNIMNPGAFSSMVAAPGFNQQPASLQHQLQNQAPRPGFHARSVTSPSNATSTEGHGFEPDMGDELVSDDERSTGYQGTAGAHDNAARWNKGGGAKKSSYGMGSRELKEGNVLKGKSRLRSTSQAPGSPEVPKVPQAYLQNLRQPDN